MELELLNMLVCPECKEALKVEGSFLKCGKCNLSFEIKEGVPVFVK